jgi:integrase
MSAGGLGPSRIRNAYRLLSGILRAATEADYLARTPCVGVRLPRLPRKEMLVLSRPQVRLLSEAMPPRYRALVYVLAYGGLRWGEACALRKDRCELERCRLQIVESVSEVNGKVHFGPTKTYSRRAARVPQFVAGLLADHLEQFTKPAGDALVFTSPRGGPLRGPNFRRRVWAPALRTAGLPPTCRVHDYADLRVMPT